MQDFITNIDVLYHCAAEIRDESNMHNINVQGTKNLIKTSANEITTPRNGFCRRGC